MNGKGGRRRLKSIMINTNYVGGHREGSTAQRRQVVTLSHLTMLMDSDCNGLCGGDSIMGGI